MLDQPLLVGMGAGKGAFRVAEQFRFNQFFRQRGAINFDERFLGAQRVVVNGVRDQFLARAGLAHDEHVGVRLGDRFNRLIDGLHLFGRADDVEILGAGRQLPPHAFRLSDQGAPFERFLDQRR